MAAEGNSSSRSSSHEHLIAHWVRSVAAVVIAALYERHGEAQLFESFQHGSAVRVPFWRLLPCVHARYPEFFSSDSGQLLDGPQVKIQPEVIASVHTASFEWGVDHQKVGRQHEIEAAVSKWQRWQSPGDIAAVVSSLQVVSSKAFKGGVLVPIKTSMSAYTNTPEFLRICSRQVSMSTLP